MKQKENVKKSITIDPSNDAATKKASVILEYVQHERLQSLWGLANALRLSQVRL